MAAYCDATETSVTQVDRLGRLPPVLTEHVRALLADHRRPVNSGFRSWRGGYHRALTALRRPAHPSCACDHVWRCVHPAGAAGRRVAGYEMMLLAGPLRPEAADGLRALGRLYVDEFNVIEVGNALGSWRRYIGRLTDTGTGTGNTVRVHHQVAPDLTLQPHDLLLDGTRTGRLRDDPAEVTSIGTFRATYWQ